MKGIYVGVNKPYKVILGEDTLTQVGQLIKRTDENIRKVFIITDSNVAPIYLDKVKTSIRYSKLISSELIIEAGEKSKTIDNANLAWELMASNGFTRTDAVLALGGGVVGDIAGFVAANFLRGVKVIQAPTSLLAMVDSAIGGKTGIDLPSGKNMVGAFFQPSLVIEDISCLSSLPDSVFIEGMAEVIKYALAMDKSLFEILEKESIESIRENNELIETIISLCVRNKVGVVVEDEHDNGRRQILNFGHTIGHVLEKRSNYEISHGICVSKGMALIINASMRRGEIDETKALRMLDLLAKYSLPTSEDISVEDIVEGSLSDKKRRGELLSLVLLDDIGSSYIREVTSEELSSFLG